MDGKKEGTEEGKGRAEHKGSEGKVKRTGEGTDGWMDGKKEGTEEGKGRTEHKGSEGKVRRTGEGTNGGTNGWMDGKKEGTEEGKGRAEHKGREGELKEKEGRRQCRNEGRKEGRIHTKEGRRDNNPRRKDGTDVKEGKKERQKAGKNEKRKGRKMAAVGVEGRKTSATFQTRELPSPVDCVRVTETGEDWGRGEGREREIEKEGKEGRKGWGRVEEEGRGEGPEEG
jgi:hypothetical protein